MRNGKFEMERASLDTLIAALEAKKAAGIPGDTLVVMSVRDDNNRPAVALFLDLTDVSVPKDDIDNNRVLSKCARPSVAAGDGFVPAVLLQAWK